jgi:hypothetical protein
MRLRINILRIPHPEEARRAVSKDEVQAARNICASYT